MRHKNIFRLFLIVLFLGICFFLNLNAVAEERKDQYKQLSEEEREIIEMLDILENYEMLKNMRMLEGMKVGEQGYNGKDSNKRMDYPGGGGR